MDVKFSIENLHVYDKIGIKPAMIPLWTLKSLFPKRYKRLMICLSNEFKTAKGPKSEMSFLLSWSLFI